MTDPARSEMFGELVVQAGLCGAEEVQECLAVQEKLAAQGKNMGLADIMVRKRYITAFQARALLGEQRFAEIRTEDLLYGRIAVANRLIGETQLAAALQRQAQAQRQGGAVPRLGDILARDCGLSAADLQRIEAAQQRLARARLRCACGWLCAAGRAKPAECPQCGRPFPPNLRELLKTTTAAERRRETRLKQAAIFAPAALLLLLALFVAIRGRPPAPAEPALVEAPAVKPLVHLDGGASPRNLIVPAEPPPRDPDADALLDGPSPPAAPESSPPWEEEPASPPPPPPPPASSPDEAQQGFWNQLDELVDAGQAGEAAFRIARDTALDEAAKLKALRNLVVHLLNRRRYDETAQALEALELLGTDDPWVRCQRGQLALCQERFDEALVIYEALVGVEAVDLEARLGRAIARAQLGQLREARSDFVFVRDHALRWAPTCEDWLAWIDRELAAADGPTAPPTGPDRPGAGTVPPPAAIGPPSPIQAYLDRERAFFEDRQGHLPWSQAYPHETPHYRIRTNVRRDQAEFYGRLLEAYHAKYEQVFAAGADEATLTRVRQTRSEVRIYAQASEFALHEDQAGALGLYYSGTRALALFHGNSGPYDNSRTTIAHEAAHQFQHLLLGANFARAPIWLLEGFAAFFESAYYDDQAKAIVTGFVTRRYIESLRRGIATGEVIDLKTMIGTPQREFGYLHYAHAWLYIHMMIYHGSKKTRARNQKMFSELFFSAARGRLEDGDVVSFFGGPQGMAEIQDEWRKYAIELPLDFDPRKR